MIVTQRDRQKIALCLWVQLIARRFGSLSVTDLRFLLLDEPASP